MSEGPDRVSRHWEHRGERQPFNPPRRAGRRLPGLSVCPYKGREGYSRHTVEHHGATLGPMRDGTQAGARARGRGVQGAVPCRPAQRAQPRSRTSPGSAARLPQLTLPFCLRAHSPPNRCGGCRAGAWVRISLLVTLSLLPRACGPPASLPGRRGCPGRLPGVNSDRLLLRCVVFSGY